MPTVRIWALESDEDEKVVECLANKLAIYLRLNNLSIKTAGQSTLASIKRRKRDKPLKAGILNFLKEDDYVIFILDLDSPRSTSQRRSEPNSLINQVEELVNENSNNPTVFFRPAVYEIEAWLLIDCLGIFCYFARRYAQFRGDCRQKVSTQKRIFQLVKHYQKGDTKTIIEAVTGGTGPKEYLRAFSEEILLVLNPKMPQKNVSRERYQVSMSPRIAEYVEISKDTVRRNNSLGHLGGLLSRLN